MRDPYTILGVQKSAGADDIKKAYHKLAKRFHPDRNKTDPKARDKFAEANSAYEILGDEKKKGQFDRGEIDAEGKPRGFEGFGAGGPGGGFRRAQGAGGAQHFEFGAGGPGGGFDPGDIFSELFGGRGRGAGARQQTRKGEDVTGTVTVSLAESVAGTTTRVILPSGRQLEVKVPAGIEDGKQIRLKGQGTPAATGGEPGDAIVTIRVLPDPRFRVEGRDLRLELPVTLYEAVLGGKVEAPTLTGAVELNLPAGSNSGRTLRLRGKGLPASGGQPAGDQLVTIRVVLPEQSDPELEALMRRWREARPYRPREG